MIVLAVCVLLPLSSSLRADENAVLEKAVQWLVDQQDESGAWKSKHYGAMKQGAALTSLALYSLSIAPESIRDKHKDVIDQAFLFLEKGTLARGRVANPDGSLDHPVYCTSMYLTAAHRFRRKLDAKQVGVLLDFLVRSQCVEGRGFSPDNPNHGGWDVIGPDVMAGKTSGTNVSVTRYVLEAYSCYVPTNGKTSLKLDEETVGLVTKSRQHAIKWLERLQKMNTDGGFRFSAQPGTALNKSKTEDGTPRSYASATSDGFLALYFGGVDGGEIYDSVLKWQKQNATAIEVTGFGEESSWPDALRYYHLQAMARAASVSSDVKWASQINSDVSAYIAQAQREDGRFENKSALMREDDPIIATSFAIVALSSQ